MSTELTVPAEPIVVYLEGLGVLTLVDKDQQVWCNKNTGVYYQESMQNDLTYYTVIDPPAQGA